MSNPIKSFVPAIVGVVAAIGIGLGLASPASSYVAFILFGGIIGALFGTLATNWVPFDFKKLRGNAPRPPLPTVFDNTVARENGSVVSSTLLAKVFAVIFALVIIGLLVIVAGAEPFTVS